MYNRVIDTIGKIKVVDLFPYKIKDVNNFIFRDHIPYNPNKKESKKYWQDFITNVVEGKWVDDNGTWVYMMPTLFFYINAGTIEVEADDMPRHFASPWLRDNEWIIQTFLYCCDRFSGFMEDHEFTCNDVIRRLRAGETNIPRKIVDRALKYGKKPNGDLKEYIDPWEYLTVHYLLENPAQKPLGLPLYQNEALGGTVITARGVGKSFQVAGARLVQKFLTNGARYIDEYRKGGLKIEMFAGAADSIFLNKFLKIAENCILNLPGTEEGYPSPLFREYTGQWSDDRTPIQQVFIDGNGKKRGSFSEIIKGVFQGHRNFVVVSRRYVDFYADEFGLIPRARTVLGAADSSMMTMGKRTGSPIMTGTGGNVQTIQEPQEIFLNPEMYGMFGIPNYWGNGNLMGLFVPDQYCYQDFKDENGNTNLLLATKTALDEWATLEKNSQISALANRKMNRPLDPTHPFLAADVNIFPQENISERISVLEAYLWKTRAKPVELDITKDRKVVIKEIPNAISNVIKNPNDAEQTGECVMYEPPMVEDEELKYRHNLYKVVYDTVSDKLFDEAAIKNKKGSKKPSWVAIKVIKETPRRLGTNDLRNTVVFEFIGRRHNPDDHHKIALAVCILYNATCLFESNVGNVISYFQRFDCERYLQPTPWTFIEKNSPYAERKTTYGVTMTTDLKSRCLKYTNAWAREVFQVPIVGDPFTNIDNLWSLRLLYEMLLFGEGNFDALSAFLLYMLWRQDELELQETDAEVEEQNKDMEELENFAFNYRYE